MLETPIGDGQLCCLDGVEMPSEMPEGEWLKRVRERAGLRQEDLADRVGVHKITVAKWEAREVLPRGRKDEIAELLGVPPREMPSSANGEASPSEYVTSDDDIGDWRDAVGPSDLVSPDARFILMMLPKFLDKRRWIVSVSEETFAGRTNTPLERIRQFWREAIDSPFVEHVGCDKEVQERGVWVLSLRFP